MRRVAAHAGLPVGLTIVLFLFEGFWFGDISGFLPAILGLAAMLAGVAALPLKRISLREAWHIYAWFLFASAAVAYLDYEVMLAHGLWFSERSQDDPGKYIELAGASFEYVAINDPGFVQLLQYLWTVLEAFGQPHYLGLVNCVMVLSSVFAVCCLEVARVGKPGARLLPYLFVFNPLVVALNASLMRDILLGAVGWSSVLCGVVLLTHERRSVGVTFWSALGFVGGAAAIYFMRTVSLVFFLGATLAISASRGRSLNKVSYAITCLGLVYLLSGVGSQMLERSLSYVEVSEVVIENARASGSVASLFLGGLPGRIVITIGGTAVYGMPFWRIPIPLMVSEVLFGCGALFAQMFTALPFIVGLVFVARRRSVTGWAMLMVYFGWVVASAIMLQGHVRYVTSHLLPVIAAIGIHGWAVLGAQPKAIRRLYYMFLFAAFLVVQVLIDYIKAQL